MCLWFGKPQMWMKTKYDGWNSLCTHLSKWVQAYGAQPTWRHTVHTVGNTIGKEEWATKWCEIWPRSMVRPSMQKHIHAEAFDKVHEALNVVHHVKRTDWDLCVPVALWAYRTMWKTLTARALPKLKYEAEAVIAMEHAKPSLRIAAIIDTMVPEAWKGGIMQPQET